jgi:hypothetical protein
MRDICPGPRALQDASLAFCRNVTVSKRDRGLKTRLHVPRTIITLSLT